MRGRRYCEHSPTGAHRAFYSARTNPETTIAPCRDCGIEVRKDVNGAWFEPLPPTWYIWAAIGFIAAAIIAYAIGLWWASS
jgi:hypothetical protein